MQGMRVPDDVTLLWCDDNWGNIRRLPTPEERKRSGGAGIYYHFDYVGGPRNYKWLEHQSHLQGLGADESGLPIRCQPHLDRQCGRSEAHGVSHRVFLDSGVESRSAGRTRRSANSGACGRSASSAQNMPPSIADIVAKYTKYNGRRKPELLEPGTFSLENYQEAETVLADWKALTGRAEQIYQRLPAECAETRFSNWFCVPSRPAPS